jgi:hypothetical protein
VGPRGGLDAMEKRKILTLPGSNPGRLARNSSLYQLTYPDSDGGEDGWITFKIGKGKSMELAHHCAHWCALISTVSSFWLLL